jgi:hypothetical protein
MPKRPEYLRLSCHCARRHFYRQNLWDSQMPIPVACSFAVGKLPGITTLAFVPMGQPKRKKARQSKRYEESMQSRK